MGKTGDLPSAPGWYRDPDGVYEHEAYWDGERWTGATRHSARAESRRATRQTLLIIVSVLLGTGLLLGVAGCVTDIYCNYDFTYLPALKSDPMAKLDLPGTSLSRTYAHGEGRVLGKPTHAEVMRVYRIEDQEATEHVLQKAAEYAKSVGWEIDGPSPSGGYGGEKTLMTGRARISIGVGADDPLNDPDGPRVLVVTIANLEYEFP